MFNQIPLYAGKRIQTELIPRAAIFAHLKNLSTCNVSILMNKKAQLVTKACLHLQTVSRKFCWKVNGT